MAGKVDLTSAGTKRNLSHFEEVILHDSCVQVQLARYRCNRWVGPASSSPGAVDESGVWRIGTLSFSEVQVASPEPVIEIQGLAKRARQNAPDGDDWAEENTASLYLCEQSKTLTQH